MEKRKKQELERVFHSICGEMPHGKVLFLGAHLYKIEAIALQLPF